MKRNYNPNKVKTKFSYSFSEIAALFAIHKQTVQEWRLQGLKIIDESVKPYLVYGEDLRIFLKQRAAKRKVKLNEGEFYCTKCRAARLSAGGEVRIEYTEKKLGKSTNMAYLKGNCDTCGTNITMFTSERKVKEMFLNRKAIMVQGEGLTGNEYPSLKTNIMATCKNISYEHLQLFKKSS